MDVLKSKMHRDKGKNQLTRRQNNTINLNNRETIN